MDALKAAIAQKRASTATQIGQGPPKRWRRVGEIEAEREARYRAEQERKAEAEALREAEKRKELENVKSNHEEKDNYEKETKDALLPKDEVIRRLRQMREPATLFGEEEGDRFTRLLKLELERERRKGDNAKGQTNVFQKKLREMEARDRDHDLYLKDRKENGIMTKEQLGHNGDGEEGNAVKPMNGDTDEKEAQGLLKMECGEDFVYESIKKWMRCWKQEIDDIPVHERRTNKGRSAAARYEQTKEYLKPLDSLLMTRKLPRNILTALRNIFECVEQKAYVKANDFYLQLAIGNAPWPMGATMVGIHARSAREKIGEGKIAHVMNDEQTRKYIQAVKRLVTFAQRIAPTVPSKMIGT